ncbi:MAG: dipeptidyl aminopeptidase/acylaminoacyl-peptidase, partial [Betaproteobacteria bacterium]|nr:dipeptidyl aminopeptidase/acylaminoacyl-peptidase [Betaproteobacteria bacterium]
MAKENTYFMYFPGNYRWSAAFINMMGSAPYGGSDIGELHKIGQLLKDKAPEDDEAWFDACAKVADGVREQGRKFEDGGHRYSAAASYLRACNYYQMAERFRTPKDEKALKVYKTAVDCFHRHAKLTDVNIEIVEVPFEGGSLPG